jgi:hypothetical protein
MRQCTFQLGLYHLSKSQLELHVLPTDLEVPPKTPNAQTHTNYAHSI